MEPQDAINLLIGACGMLFGYILNGVRQSVNALHQADTDLTNRVQQIEVLVAGKYITREEMNMVNDKILQKLDSIERKLEHKADK